MCFCKNLWDIFSDFGIKLLKMLWWKNKVLRNVGRLFKTRENIKILKSFQF